MIALFGLIPAIMIMIGIYILRSIINKLTEEPQCYPEPKTEDLLPLGTFKLKE